MQGAWVPSLLGELRSYMLWGVANIFKNKNKQIGFLYSHIFFKSNLKKKKDCEVGRCRIQNSPLPINSSKIHLQIWNNSH